LVLLPTRELALQVEENLRLIGVPFGLRTVSLIGGEAVGKQLARLKQNPHIIVATPGRLIDFIGRKVVGLREVNVLVLDEADMMLDMGFLPQVEEILKSVPKDRQTMLFSATMPTEIAKLAANHLRLPVTIEVAPAGTTADKVEQEIYVVEKDAKFDELKKLLASQAGSVLVFVRTRRGAEGLTVKLKRFGHEVAEIHSNRSFEQRKSALASFKSGKSRILVATDIAARGIDVKGIELVINYDLPDDTDDYVHRIGRTARAGQSGRAVSFATPDQFKDVKSIERLIKKEISLVEIAKFNQPAAKAFGGGNRRGGGRSESFSRGSMNSLMPMRTAKIATPEKKVMRIEPVKREKTYKISAGDLDLQNTNGLFGGGLQKKYHSYAEKLKDQAGGGRTAPERRGRIGGRKK
jgi:ATP-dependent RNA helicase RhlE